MIAILYSVTYYGVKLNRVVKRFIEMATSWNFEEFPFWMDLSTFFSFGVGRLTQKSDTKAMKFWNEYLSPK